MSSANRATSRGSKGGKGEHVAATAKAQKLDTKTETAKSTDNPKAQPTPEQMRIAQIIDGRYEDPQIKEKIKQIMDATHKSEIEVCTALHDCDNDANRAVNMLIEGQISTDWETSSKKKKSRQPSANAKPDAGAPRGISSDVVESENWDDDTPTKPSIPVDAQRARTQRGGGGAPRMRGRGAQDNRGWRGRENKENERNLEESRGSVAAGGDRDQRDGFRRGGGGNRGGRMSNGAGRGGGRGGSRTGPRSFSGRGGHDRGAPFPRATSWNPDEDGADAKSSNFPSPEDWDNEEYTGSLSDTKVFTPSNVGADGNDAVGSHPVNSGGPDPALTTSPGVNSTNLNYAQSAAGGGSLSAAQTQYLRQLPDNKLPSSNALSGAMSGLNSMSGPLPNSADSKTATRGIAPSTPSSGMTYNSYAASAAHSAASSAPAAASYPSTYSSVSASVPSVSTASEANFTPSSGGSNFSTYQSGQTQPASYTATATSYSTVYGSHQDGSTQATGAQPLPARTKTQRPRVPPPSKIPQSAVEMPGDGVNNIGLLDVQFGALDFGTDAFDTNSSEPQPSPQSTPSSQSQSHPNPMTKYSAGTGGGMDSAPVASSQPSMDLDPFTTAGQKAAALTQTLKETLLQGSQSQQTQASSQSQNNDLKSQPTNFTQQSRGPGVGVVVPSALDSLVKSDQSSVGSAANASGGSGAAGSLSYSAPSSNYQSSYNTQKSVGSGYQSTTGYNPASYSSSQASSGVSASSSNAYPASYPSNASSQAYQQNVYGGSGGSSSATGGSNSGSTVGSSSGYTTSSNAGVYQNSYGTTTASASSTNKLTSVLNAAKDLPQYDTTATSSSNLSGPITSSTSGAPGLSVPNVSGSVNNSPSLGLPGATSLPNANNTSSTKVTNSSAKSVVQNMPPGVPPIIPAGTQYIMSQGGLQYFQQPAVYSYEEQQILPLRIPHMPAGYYDISFQQAPTSLATGREGSLANVPYSMSDARFARTDNASPVPSSLSQQNATQAHQQPMMNAAGFPPGYAAYAYYGGSVLPANYQYGTPTALYPQVAPATNAHGNSNSTQYPKPGNYGSSYGSGYDGLSASQDYSKGGGGYAGGHSGAQTASKAGVGANAPSTGSSATDIYNKTHVALSKVNSYDKGFHSGTPPPFNLAGNQNTGMAPSGAFPTPLYIPPPMHQPHHQSTTLMQHQVPVHQQMDMRNTSRRSESGNNSGQRSQSSTQSNKTGSKQVYSPNYWAN